MCVIAFAPKGVAIPTEEQIKQMWQANPDGAGFAYVGKRGKVCYKKGYMTLESLLGALKEPEKYKNTNFAIHFRIGTSGKNDAATCHPFPVSNNFGDLRATRGTAQSVLFHNGVLSNGGMVNQLASDTQDFVVAMSPLIQKYNKSRARDYFIEELVQGNRVLILYKDNKYKMYGRWEKDGELWVSNTHYKYASWYASQTKSDNCYAVYPPADDYDDEWYSMMYPEAYSPKTISSTPKPATSTPTEAEWQNGRERANTLFAKAIADGYVFTEPSDLDIIKTYADDCYGGVTEYCGYTFGYEETQGLLWLEEEPQPEVVGEYQVPQTQTQPVLQNAVA